ncbi:glycosyltransferase [Aerophototrophica crusticola]|uniref:glycosyltransferase n=1 Tax=Aerophototrophica crusticola TaxID=1709002 RepID=UPI003850DE97
MPRLARFIRAERPRVLVSHLGHGNIMAVLAAAGTGTKVVACQHNALSAQTSATGTWSHRVLPRLYRMTQRWTAGFVAVSEGVAADWSAAACIPRRRIATIYNPVIDAGFQDRAAGTVDHAWYRDRPAPLLVAVGRLEDQKDIPTLLQAFRILRDQREARLVLVGDGSRREMLEDLARSLGIAGDVWFAGAQRNPLPFIRGADLLALSSRFEGFGLVLVEALACGTPVVSTDCPHGPSEVLGGGRYGRLVPPGDPAALAVALSASLDSPPEAELLRRRAADFSTEVATAAWLDILRPLLVDSRPVAAVEAVPTGLATPAAEPRHPR